jgi:RNA polymerase sigma-70 factor (ECF subfamily)
VEQPCDQNVSDEELARLCQERLPGDPRPFHALVARYRDQVINTAYRFLGDLHDAEDVAQEVFLKAYRGLPDFRATSAFSTWLYRIMVRQQRDAIQDTLDRLNEANREALILRDVQGLSYQEISAVLEIGLSAAKMRVRRARLAFRERYSPET